MFTVADFLWRVLPELADAPSLRWSGDCLVSADLPAGRLGLDGGGITLAPRVFAARCRLLAGRPGTIPCVIHPSRAVATVWERRDAGPVAGHRYRREVHYTVGELGVALLDRA
ncbi:hypothetical protein [Streptomyces sp. NPDC001930]|uniref:hypothetical protein n=1 Tax=Streptomyces sp. NPDC001930 TaxID=3364625 RepID=UPI003691E6D3